MRQYIDELTKKYDFPCKATEDFLAAYDQIQECSEAKRIYEQQIDLYEHDLLFNFGGMLQNMENACQLCNVRTETGWMVLILSLTKHLKALYEQKNLPERWFDGVIGDIKSKNDECFAVQKVYGTFVAFWFDGFFNVTRFALGRLQFEPIFTASDITVDGITVKKNSLMLNSHIPSGSPFNMEECMKSFEEACDVFGRYFKDGEVIFYCGSWMLSSINKEILSPDSNIVKFMNLFHCYSADKTIAGDFWRIFDREDCSDVKSLPQNTTLQKAYAKCIEKGEIPLFGRGIMFMKSPDKANRDI